MALDYLSFDEKLDFTFCMVVSCLETNTLLGSSINTFMESHLEDIQRGWSSEISGVGGCTTVHPAFLNMSI